MFKEILLVIQIFLVMNFIVNLRIKFISSNLKTFHKSLGEDNSIVRSPTSHDRP